MVTAYLHTCCPQRQPCGTAVDSEPLTDASNRPALVIQRGCLGNLV